MQYKHQAFLEAVHNQDRKILETNIFPFPVRTSLLHFIGASDYFITDFGAVWNRKRIFFNKHHVVTKGYQPLWLRDAEFPYPWIKLPTSMGEMWLPINQLLGWAFDPQPEIKPSYYLSNHPGVNPLDTSDCTWVYDEPEAQSESRYLAFMRTMYEVV